MEIKTSNLFYARHYDGAPPGIQTSDIGMDSTNSIPPDVMQQFMTSLMSSYALLESEEGNPNATPIVTFDSDTF